MDTDPQKSSAQTEAVPQPKTTEETPNAAVETPTEGANATPEVAGEKTTETFDPEKWLHEAPADVLRTHPRFAGIVGDALKKERIKLERELKEQVEKETTERVERERLLALRDTNPYEYVEEEKRLEAEKKRQAEAVSSQDSIKLATYGEIQASISDFINTLPAEAVNSIANKTYPGTYAQGLRAYLGELVGTLTEHQLGEHLKKARAKWEKDELPALKKQVLAEVNGGEESPDVGSGLASAGMITREEFERNRGDRAWVRENMDRINKALAARAL